MRLFVAAHPDKLWKFSRLARNKVARIEPTARSAVRGSSVSSTSRCTRQRGGQEGRLSHKPVSRATGRNRALKGRFPAARSSRTNGHNLHRLEIALGRHPQPPCREAHGEGVEKIEWLWREEVVEGFGGSIAPSIRRAAACGMAGCRPYRDGSCARHQTICARSRCSDDQRPWTPEGRAVGRPTPAVRESACAGEPAGRRKAASDAARALFSGRAELGPFSANSGLCGSCSASRHFLPRRCPGHEDNYNPVGRLDS